MRAVSRIKRELWKIGAEMKAAAVLTWHALCRLDRALEVIFCRIVVVILFLLAPFLGHVAFLGGLIVFTLIVLFHVLKSLKSLLRRPRRPDSNKGCRHG